MLGGRETVFHGLDGPGLETRCGRDSPYPSRLAQRLNQPPYNGYRVSFLGVKRPERGVYYLPTSSTEISLCDNMACYRAKLSLLFLFLRAGVQYGVKTGIVSHGTK